MTDEHYNTRLLSLFKEKEAVANECKKLQNQNGVSLVELLAVVSIIVIISALAVMNTGSSKRQLKRQNVAQELKVAFERARFDSVKRRADVDGGTDYRARVIVYPTYFTLIADVNQNGVLTDAGDSQTTNFAAADVSITSTTFSTLPVTVYFNKRGEVSNSAGVSATSFLVCNPSCGVNGGNSNANSSNANLLLVTPTGTVNLLSGGSSVPTFSAPANISSVPNNTSIKDTTVISGN